MKRASVLLFLILLFVPLFCAVFSSNELGQKKEEIESVPASGWAVEVNGNEETLYRDGRVVKKTTTTSLTTTIEEGEREESIIRNEEGLIERRIIKDGEKSEEYNYFYSGNILTGYNYSLDAALIEKVEYITDEDGLLLYYRVKDKGVYITNEAAVNEDGRKVSLLSSKGREETITRESEDGGYIETRGGVEYTYDNNGRLVKEESEDILTEYTYSDDGTLIRKKESGDGGVYVTEYGGRETVSYFKEDGTKVYERYTRDDGTIEETRYVNGKAEYLFIYDRDGRRIMEARAL